ncbi:DUF2071 domain-containing protein [Microbacterium murale]|uniref:DUF2071 domain-containing protein n=1 Tax=Microbacterium murale TaxID=1081040 RepID=A0ABQ1S1X0_9MICO|nr:DUF2071 domain-containing protein [Microbacterium murale]GGD89688.1 hypothetical protein GCM10007269_35430 [Microbacterium murale]
MTIVRGVQARLRRRLLLSYRLDADVARGLLPDGLRPLLVDGHAVAGVCVLGLESIRPRWVHGRWGLRSENAAHRIAVEWDDEGERRRGVYIFERHSSAWFPVLFGGRAFPGVHRKARFRVDESKDRYAVTMDADGESLAADVEVGGEWKSELFPTVEDASEFYRSGLVGWSRRHDGVSLEPVTLTSTAWTVEGAHLRSLRSSFFDALPEGAAVFDSVVVMRDLPIVMTA